MPSTLDDLDSLSRKLLPGGVGRGSLAVSLADGRVPTAVSASGVHIVDDEGAQLVDLNNNMTVNLHGHAHPKVLETVTSLFADGMISLGMGNHHEVQLAALLQERVVWPDKVRFANSGTEAVATAVRLARATTGKSKVVIFSPGYHGMGDSVLAAMGEYGQRGVPTGTASETLTIPPGDLDSLEHIFTDHGDNIAALLIDTCASRTGFSPLAQSYVSRARELTSRHGALLIVDEVVNFRNAYRGLHSIYDVTPDLLVLGKIIGGGFPVGAVLGTAQAMQLLDASDPDHIEHGGTFTANPVTMGAGLVTLQMFDEPAVDRLNVLCERLDTNVASELQREGWTFRRNGSAFRVFPEAAAPDKRAALQRELYRTAYAQGLLTSASGICALSTVMDDALIDQVSDPLIAAVRKVPAH